MLNILITGANGQLGSDLKFLSKNFKDYQCTFTDVEDLNIADNEALIKYFKKNKTDVVINCAAFTAVDDAEKEKEKASLLNSTAVKNLAQLSGELKFLLVHISTDYVFDGKNFKPYNEGDPTNPKSFYGKTKLDGEIEIVFNASKAVILRTSWLYSSTGKNFVKTIMKFGKERGELKVVADQIGSPTYAKDLAQTIFSLIPQFLEDKKADKVEIYNYSNEGVVSWYDFAKAIIELSKIKCKVIPIETKDYPTPAARPNYSVLNKRKIKEKFKIEIPYWKDSLAECINLLEK
ncbi:MAG: dTDP-4-dehydrorhamnose reductase [Bacteroidetes bacterium]|nr:dTDP-4-dehydrorhamnose reductase [Bacteroidota bacterium]